MRSTVLMTALAAGALALSGCGGGNDATPGSTPAGTRPDAPAPAHASANPRDALMSSADLSSEWTRAHRLRTGLACGGWNPLAGATSRMESPRFSRVRESIDIQQTLGVFADDAAAARAYQRLNSSATERCVRRAVHLRLQFHSGAGFTWVAPVTVARVEGIGKHSRNVRYVASLNAEAGDGTAYIVTINSRVGRAVASLTLVSGLAHLEETAYDALTTVQEQHLDAVFG